MAEERWLPVVAFEDRYEVSDLGRLRIAASKKIRKPNTSAVYPFVALWRNGRERYAYRYLHRLVLEAFIGPCPEGHEAAHNNGDRFDNRLENLRWATHLENVADRRLHGTDRRGEENPLAKLTDDSVREIRSLYREGRSQQSLGDQFGVTQSVIGKVVRHLSWTHVA